MKKIIISILILVALLISLFFVITSLYPKQSIHWHEYSPQVFAESKKTGHLVLLFAKSSVCHWCQETEKNSFTNLSIIKLINDNYYPVILDVDKNETIAEKYLIMGLPTIIIFNSNEKVIKTYSGYFPPEVLEKYLNESMNGNTK